jgi:exopolyphosphatase / guanosine-5'-triphosphate,3'-diphosphate pyrophosphatase
VYLGLALRYRYKSTGTDSRLAPLLTLLDEDEVRHAIMLGRAMRFGAMLSIGGPEAAGELRYFPKKKVLELVLRPELRDLYGEVAQSRFEALAKALGVSASARIARPQSSKGSVTGGSVASRSGASGSGGS